MSGTVIPLKNDKSSERLIKAPHNGSTWGIGAKPYLNGMIRDYYQFTGKDTVTGINYAW